MMRARRMIWLAAFLTVALLGAMGRVHGSDARDGFTASEVAMIASMRLSEAGPRPIDPSNRVERSAEAAKLGRQLFGDTALSGDRQVSCATCHVQETQFQDGRPTGRGVGIGRRRTMPVMGAAGAPFLFWDGRKDGLWSQALGPWEDALEHGGNRVALVRWVREHHLAGYEAVFGAMPDLGVLPDAAGPNGTIVQRAEWAAMSSGQRDRINRVFANMGKAVAAYEATVSYGESRFDRYAQWLAAGGRGNPQILTPQEIRGLRLFLNQGQCATCHNGPMLTDHAFHNTGVPAADKRVGDAGRSEGVRLLQRDEFNCLGPFSDAKPEQCDELQFLSEGDPSQLGAFRTPSLRNVVDRAPYMHAGQFATLAQVLEHYARAPMSTVGTSELARPGARSRLRSVIRLTSTDRQSIEAFLRTLTGPVVTLDTSVHR